jgi:hypothetical protein
VAGGWKELDFDGSYILRVFSSVAALLPLRLFDALCGSMLSI